MSFRTIILFLSNATTVLVVETGHHHYLSWIYLLKAKNSTISIIRFLLFLVSYGAIICTRSSGPQNFKSARAGGSGPGHARTHRSTKNRDCCSHTVRKPLHLAAALIF